LMRSCSDTFFADVICSLLLMGWPLETCIEHTFGLLLLHATYRNSFTTDHEDS
jgi:hypothetical protein